MVGGVFGSQEERAGSFIVLTVLHREYHRGYYRFQAC